MSINPLTQVVAALEKSICFIESKGKFLILNKKTSDIPESWRIPGGTIQQDEDCLQATFRLVYQQTNINLLKINFTYCCKVDSTNQIDPTLHIFHSILRDKFLESPSKNGNRLMKWVDQNQMGSINF